MPTFVLTEQKTQTNINYNKKKKTPGIRDLYHFSTTFYNSRVSFNSRRSRQGFTSDALDPLQFADPALDGAGAGVAAHPLHPQAQHDAAGRTPAGILTSARGHLGRGDT